MMQRVIGTASVVAILTLSGAGSAAGEQSQSPGLEPSRPPGAPTATTANPCAATNPCAAKNPTSAKNRAVRSPAWTGSAAGELTVDRFSGRSVSDR